MLVDVEQTGIQTRVNNVIASTHDVPKLNEARADSMNSLEMKETSGKLVVMKMIIRWGGVYGVTCVVNS